MRDVDARQDPRRRRGAPALSSGSRSATKRVILKRGLSGCQCRAAGHTPRAWAGASPGARRSRIGPVRGDAGEPRPAAWNRADDERREMNRVSRVTMLAAIRLWRWPGSPPRAAAAAPATRRRPSRPASGPNGCLPFRHVHLGRRRAGLDAAREQGRHLEETSSLGGRRQPEGRHQLRSSTTSRRSARPTRRPARRRRTSSTGSATELSSDADTIQVGAGRHRQRQQHHRRS